MAHPSLKIGAALVLGAVLFSCPAYAVSPVALDNNPLLLIPVEDEENEELMREMETDEAPPEGAAGTSKEAPQAAQPKPKEEGKGSDDVEEEEFKEDGVIPE
jgi:hypothetical protein